MPVRLKHWQCIVYDSLSQPSELCLPLQDFCLNGGSVRHRDSFPAAVTPAVLPVPVGGTDSELGYRIFAYQFNWGGGLQTGSCFMEL